eukprot:scaffold131904_cov36-Tisochrysis_lutea.AAC.4
MAIRGGNLHGAGAARGMKRGITLCLMRQGGRDAPSTLSPLCLIGPMCHVSMPLGAWPGAIIAGMIVELGGLEVGYRCISSCSCRAPSFFASSCRWNSVRLLVVLPIAARLSPPCASHLSLERIN